MTESNMLQVHSGKWTYLYYLLFLQRVIQQLASIPPLPLDRSAYLARCCCVLRLHRHVVYMLNRRSLAAALHPDSQT